MNQSPLTLPRHRPLGLLLLSCVTLILVFGAGWVIVRVVSLIGSVVAPVALALLLTGLLMPLHLLLNHRLRLSRYAAAGLTVLGSTTVLMGVVLLSGAEIVSGVNALRQDTVIRIDQLEQTVIDSPIPVGREQLRDGLDQVQQWLSGNAGDISRGVLSIGTTAGGVLVGGLLALVVTFFFLAQGDVIWSWLVCLLPAEWRGRVHQAFRRGWVTLGTYAKMQIVISGADAIGIGIGAAVLGLPFLLPMILIVFLLCFIPILGAWLSGALVVLVALAFEGPVAAVIMLVVVVVVQQLESNLLSPFLMGKAVNLHPLAIMLAVASGSYLMGLFGALFTVPFLAVINTVALYFSGRDMFPALAEGGSALTDSARTLSGDRPETTPPRRVGEVSPAWMAWARRTDAERAAEQSAHEEGAHPDDHRLIRVNPDDAGG